MPEIVYIGKYGSVAPFGPSKSFNYETEELELKPGRTLKRGRIYVVPTKELAACLKIKDVHDVKDLPGIMEELGLDVDAYDKDNAKMAAAIIWLKYQLDEKITAAKRGAGVDLMGKPLPDAFKPPVPIIYPPEYAPDADGQPLDQQIPGEAPVNAAPDEPDANVVADIESTDTWPLREEIELDKSISSLRALARDMNEFLGAKLDPKTKNKEKLRADILAVYDEHKLGEPE